MLIGFDASRAFVSEATGTENYSLNLLKALARIDRKNRYRVYLRDFSTPSLRDHEVAKQSRQKIATLLSVARNDKVGQGWPSNFEFKVIRPSRLWTQFGLALETWKYPVDVLFVPAHTLPILRRRFLALSSRGSQGPVAIFKDCFSLAGLGIAMTNRRRMKTVVTIHDLGVEYLPNYHKFPQRYYLDFASRYAAAHADAIIAVSAATSADLVMRYKVDSKKISVVHEGVDSGFFKPSSKFKVQSSKLKYKIKGPYILFVGTIQPRKNLEMLIEAFSKVCGMVGKWDGRKTIKPTIQQSYYPKNLQLVIAGKLGWDYKKILDAPKKFGAEKMVNFIGRVDDSDLPALYSGAAAFVFPSLFEGFGLPILEALSCGCPVVASDIAPHREIYKKLRTSNFELRTSGNLVPMVLAKPNDVVKWVRVLYQTITKYDKRFDLNIKKLNLEAKFGWDEAAKKTLKVFEAVLE